MPVSLQVPASLGYAHGLHLRGTALWFDAGRARELCVLTGLEGKLPPVHRRVVASAPLAAALERAGYGAVVLPMPWKRWMGLAGHQIQLMETAAQPGGAMALVGQDPAPMLIAGLLRASQVEAPRAQHWVGRVPGLLHQGSSLDAVVEQVAIQLDRLRSKGQRPSIGVETLDVGVALGETLHRLGHRLQWVGLLAKLMGSSLKGGMRLPTLGLIKRDTMTQMQTARPTIWIDSGLGKLADADPQGDIPPLRLRWYADMPTLQKAVAQSQAQQVTLLEVPPQAEETVRCVLGPHVRVHFLSKTQQWTLPRVREHKL